MIEIREIEKSNKKRGREKEERRKQYKRVNQVETRKDETRKMCQRRELRAVRREGRFYRDKGKVRQI